MKNRMRYKQKIEELVEKINNMLWDCSYTIAVDIEKGIIEFIKNSGCVYGYCRGITKKELFKTLSVMVAILTLKEEKNERR